MRYGYDTEFSETGYKRPVELISIGIAREDGVEYYAQCVNFDPRRLHDWVREHVMPQLHLCESDLKDRVLRDMPQFVRGQPRWYVDWFAHFHRLPHPEGGSGACMHPSCPWRTRDQLAVELRAFFAEDSHPELWGYYADYDHVLLMQTFGTMMQKPHNLPMWTRDIKQLCVALGDPHLPEHDAAMGEGEHSAIGDARWVLTALHFLERVARSQHERDTLRGAAALARDLGYAG